MKRQDLRNRAPKFKVVDTWQPWPKKQRRIRRIITVLKVIGVTLLLFAALWYTNPVRLFPECQGDDVPRNCVD